MNARHLARHAIRTATAALLVGASLAAQPASAQAPDLFVTVFADRYVVNGQAFDDLDVLERAVAPTRPGAVRIYACGSAAARAQLAAAHRFRDRYLELRVLDESAQQCRATAAAVPQLRAVAARPGPAPYGIDDAAVARWWYDMMP